MNDDVEIQKDDEDIEPDEQDASDIAAKLKKVKVELKACQKEKGEYLAGWQRAKADFINARRDEEKQREQFLKFIEEKLMRELLAIADSFKIALEHEPSLSLTPIYRQLQELFRSHGVNPIESERQKFDPSQHEALGEIEAAKPEEDGIILEELQKGYMMHDRVLRPSKVKVGIYKA